MADPAPHPATDSVTMGPRKKSSRNALLVGLAGIVLAGLGAYGVYWFTSASKYQATDNAYVGADTAQVTPLVSAPVAEVLVKETQAVHAGDLLVQLDPADARLALAEGVAKQAQAQSDVVRTRVDLRRRSALAPSGAVSKDELTSAQNAFAASTAAAALADAQVQAAQLALSRMTIRAPVDGIISDKTVHVGQRVEAGAPLMVIAPLSEAYVDANFKENQLKDVKVGQKVTLHADIYGDKITYHGRVTGLSGGTGAAFALIPTQNASGNWIKVVQRVPVRIALDPAELQTHPLRIGMSMSARIDVTGRP